MRNNLVEINYYISISPCNIPYSEAGVFKIKNYKFFLMEKDLKDKVVKRLSLIGMKKSHLAKQMGISTSQLSQSFSGSRKLQPEEETKLKITLNL